MTNSIELSNRTVLHYLNNEVFRCLVAKYVNKETKHSFWIQLVMLPDFVPHTK